MIDAELGPFGEERSCTVVFWKDWHLLIVCVGQGRHLGVNYSWATGWDSRGILHDGCCEEGCRVVESGL